MNPTMMMMAMANQKKRSVPTDRITNRPTKAQVAWIKAIEDDSTKEVIHVSEGSPVSLSVEVLDHALSLSFNGPVLVTVVLDLLANEKTVEIHKTGVQSRRLILWADHGGREQTNIWHPFNPSSPVMWDGTPGHYYNESARETNAQTKAMLAHTEVVARALFCSATNGGSPGYRGSKLTASSCSEAKKKFKITA
jgi:hypothetical protein